MNLKNLVRVNNQSEKNKGDSLETRKIFTEDGNDLPLVLSEKYVDNQLQSINDMLRKRNFSLLTGVSTLSSEMYRPRRISREQIRRAVTNPYGNVEILQQASMLLKATNGIYKKVLNYQSTILTNDYMIYPLSVDKINNPQKLKKSYQEVALYLEKLDVKQTACWIYERIFEQGELYIYKLEDSSGIAIQEIPNTLCKITSIENGIQKFGINLAKLNEKTVLAMPKEIQNIFISYKNGSIKPEDLIDKSFYELKKNAVAFNLDKFSTKGIPFFATAFDDLMDLEDMKDLKSENAIIESIKLIHQKLPTDKNTGVVLMDFNVATAYHNATKKNLPTGTGITTNPLDLQAITLSDGSNKINQNVTQSLNNIYDTMGVNNELFNGNKSTNEAIAAGIVADGLLTKRAQMMVQNWINYELSSLKKVGITWRMRFVDSTHFDKDSRAKTAREDMAFGGLRTEFFATKGYTPLESMNLLVMEGLLGISELMKPQESAHTASGKENGRPKKDGSNSDGLSSKAEQE